MSVLTAEVLEELVRKVRGLGRSPVIEYSHSVTEIYEGALVDEVLEQTLPNFDKIYHKGYLVPVKYRKILEDSIDSKNESM